MKLAKKRILKNTLSLALVQVVNYVAPFLILAHLTKVLGLELYGVLAFSQGIIAISFVLLDFGYTLAATNKISVNRHNKIYVAKIIGGISVVKLFLFLLCCLGVVAYSYLTDKYADHRLIFLLSLLPLAMQGFAPLWFFHGVEQMKYFAAVSIAAKIIFAITAVTFIKVPSDYWLVPLFNGLGQLVTLCLSIFLIYKLGYGIRFPNIKLVMYCFKFSKHFFISRMAVASYMNGGVIVLGLTTYPAAVALYSMAEQLYKVMQSALGPVAVASYPYMTKEKDTSLMLKLIFGVISTALIGACLGYYFAPILVKMVFDETWLAAIPVLNIFLIAIVIHAGAIMMGYPLAALVGRLKVANSSVVTGSLTYFIFLGAISFLGIVEPLNLAIIMLVSELVVLIHRSVVLLPIVIKRREVVSI